MDKSALKGDAINRVRSQIMIAPTKFLLGLAWISLLGWTGNAVGGPEPGEHAAPGVQHVDAKQAQKLVEGKKVVVLDIRTAGEFATGRIAGAKNIDFQGPDFEQRIETLDKSKSYLVHCASGGRSSHSLLLFKKHHFQSVYNLDGGIRAWQKDGLPIEK